MPKEIRNPKSEEARVQSDAVGRDSGSLSWSSESCGPLVLHEGAPSGEKRDLLERTALFGEAVIRFSKKVPRGVDHPENNRLIDQLVGASTSVGANYCEADDAVSGKDYRNKIGTCRKEAKEAMFFLRMVAASQPALADEARGLWREAKELNLIFGSIWRSR